MMRQLSIESLEERITLTAKLLDDFIGNKDQLSADQYYHLNGETFFIHGGSEDVELWKTDGSESGTEFIKRLADNRGGGHRNQWRVSTVDDKLFIVVAEGLRFWLQPGESSYASYYVSDGTPEGTLDVRHVFADFEDNSHVDTFVQPLTHGLFLVGPRWSEDGPHPPVRLGITDGTKEGTRLLDDTRLHSAYPVGEVNGHLVVRTQTDRLDRELWVSNPEKSSGTILDLWQEGRSDPADFNQFSGRLFFTAQTELGRELWATDGTPDGTQLVVDIHPGAASSDPSDFHIIGDRLFFSAETESGRNLWMTDGTTVGTRLVIDSESGDPSNNPSQLEDVDDQLFFVAQKEAGQISLQHVGLDGISTEVAILEDTPKVLRAHNDVLYYVLAEDATSRLEFWSVGNAMTPQSLGSVEHYQTTAIDVSMIRSGDRLLAVVSDDFSACRQHENLCRGGSTLISIHEDSVESLGEFSNHVRVMGEYEIDSVFAADDQIWITDGTVQGTRSITPAKFPSVPAVIGGNLLFDATMEDTRMIWRYDGDSVAPLKLISGKSGSVQVHSVTNIGAYTLMTLSDSDFQPLEIECAFLCGTTTSFSLRLIATDGKSFEELLDGRLHYWWWNAGGYFDYPTFFYVDGLAYFADQSEDGGKLWKTDFTKLGTMPASIEELHAVDVRFRFAETGLTGPEEYKVTNSPMGSQRLGNSSRDFPIAEFNSEFTAFNQLRFADNGDQSSLYWRDHVSNSQYESSTLAGASKASMQLARTENGVYFAADAWDGTMKLLRVSSDGDLEAVEVTQQIMAQLLAASPNMRSGDALYFQVEALVPLGIPGIPPSITLRQSEVWQLNLDGFQLVPQPTGDNQPVREPLTVNNGHYFFLRNTPEYGTEIWSSELPQPDVTGDIIGDRKVDFDDFLVLSANFGRAVDDGVADGDLDRDGLVGFSDFLLLSRFFDLES